jgi:hypothetical protein
MKRYSRTVTLFLLSLFMLVSLHAAYAQDATANYTVTYEGRIYDPASNRTTFTYVVTGLGSPPDLSHFDLEIPICSPALQVVAYAPIDAVSFGVDPTTGINGIKWDLPLGMNDSRTYTLSFAGDVAESDVLAAVKGGNGFFTVEVLGASCLNPSIDVEKFISVDGVTWLDADQLPGPDVALDATVAFRFVVTNDGNVPLASITLSDNLFDLATCTLPATLDPGVFFECTLPAQPVTAGQHTNTATATGQYEGEVVTDSDGANYYGGDRPGIDVEKYVSSDGTTWADVDAPPGPQLLVSTDVWFRFVVTNIGTTSLTNVTLSDNMLDLAACAIPTELAPGQTAECIVGPLVAIDGQHSNVATVQAQFNGTTVTDSDSAHYRGGDTQLPVTIIIEGPVQAININIITIYDIDIEIDTDDPILNVIQIGDFIRVEGDMVASDNTIVVIAIFVTIINVDVVVNVDGAIWRDPGDCGNPPPPWAPAYGWRRRCGGGIIIIGDDGMGMGDDGMGMGDDGMGMGD